MSSKPDPGDVAVSGVACPARVPGAMVYRRGSHAVAARGALADREPLEVAVPRRRRLKLGARWRSLLSVPTPG